MDMATKLPEHCDRACQQGFLDLWGTIDALEDYQRAGWPK
jgi:hypothetical protein